MPVRRTRPTAAPERPRVRRLPIQTKTKTRQQPQQQTEGPQQQQAPLELVTAPTPPARKKAVLREQPELQGPQEQAAEQLEVAQQVIQVP